MKEKDKILDIILNDNYLSTDKVIMIYKELSNDMDELSAVTNIPAIMLQDYTPVNLSEYRKK